MLDGKKLPEIKVAGYQFTEEINIRKSANGSSLDVMIGYVTAKPEEKAIVLSSRWPVSNGFYDSKIFYIKRKEDWHAICETVNKVWPEVDGKVSENELREAVKKVATERKLLDLFTQNPELADSLPENADLLSLPPEQKSAVLKLQEAGGGILMNTLGKLSDEPLGDVQNFNSILETYRLATVNSLVTHITGRLSFIDIFEKAIHDDATFERRGDDSIHNLLRQNIWLVNPNYQILQDDVTLKKIIYENWNKNYIGEVDGKRPDFLCMTELVPRDDMLVIIEIKRPSVKLEYDMLKQVAEYRQILRAHSQNKYQNFKCLLVGREMDDLLQDGNFLKGFEVKTYTDFIGEARRFYQEYLQLIKQNPQAI